jgi:hypothetical protein
MDPKIEDAVGYPEIVMVRVNVWNLHRFRSRAALMLDIDFEVKGSYALQSDGNDLVASQLLFAVLIRLSWLDEVCRWFSVDFLLKDERCEFLGVVLVEAVRKF